MSTFVELAIVSDIHYPGPLERARGHEYEFEGIRNPRAKLLLRLFRKYIWLHRPVSSQEMSQLIQKRTTLSHIGRSHPP